MEVVTMEDTQTIITEDTQTITMERGKISKESLLKASQKFAGSKSCFCKAQILAAR